MAIFITTIKGITALPPMKGTICVRSAINRYLTRYWLNSVLTIETTYTGFAKGLEIILFESCEYVYYHVVIRVV